MKKYIILLFLVTAQLAFSQVKEMDITTFNTESSDELVLIDVRTPYEFKAGHLKEAKNINVKDDAFIAEVKKVDKSKSVYLYCKAGGRSAAAAKILDSLGYKNIVNLDGGFDAWKKAGKPFEE
ncbi:rhodanese-like domain-containing protein [Joostella atrarenae]|uniref:Rhodanese-like domain-containing protein n=1 Tax=Joostella atrarenae TaxID=679257 RepID=A0ABS9J658_9FLAO|nr:rhodanese-like domain-containing protein [Joostella atrarenae]MCF8715889.1 rhodanese-like domain-containing protein [Joostella atrarenae]